MKITQDSEQNTKCYVEELEIYSEEYAKKLKKKERKNTHKTLLNTWKLTKDLKILPKKNTQKRVGF